MNVITKSVGRNATNLKYDVSVVQALLNRYHEGNEKLLAVDGLCGHKTILSILRFQSKHIRNRLVDGVVDPNGETIHALMAGRKHAPHPAPAHNATELTPKGKAAKEGKIAWGARVSSDFKSRVIEISSELNVAPDFLMAAMAFESGESFRPDIVNAAGSGAVGLIQFMPRTAKALGTDTDKLSKMTAVKQLDFVLKYFKEQKKKLHTIEDIYMAILYPAAVGKGSVHVLFKEKTKVYEQNKGLDKDKDGKITVGEAAGKVRAKLNKGLKPGYFG